MSTERVHPGIRFAVASLGLMSPSAVRKGVTPPLPPTYSKFLVMFVNSGPKYTENEKRKKTIEFGVKAFKNFRCIKIRFILYFKIKH